MTVFRDEVRLRCGVPDIDEIAPLPAIVGCLIGPIPILAPHDFFPPIDGPPGCDGIDGVDG